MELKHLLPLMMLLISLSECSNDVRKCICGLENTDPEVPETIQKYPWLVAIRRKVQPNNDPYYNYYTG